MASKIYYLLFSFFLGLGSLYFAKQRLPVIKRRASDLGVAVGGGLDVGLAVGVRVGVGTGSPLLSALRRYEILLPLVLELRLCIADAVQWLQPFGQTCGGHRAGRRSPAKIRGMTVHVPPVFQIASLRNRRLSFKSNAIARK